MYIFLDRERDCFLCYEILFFINFEQNYSIKTDDYFENLETDLRRD